MRPDNCNGKNREIRLTREEIFDMLNSERDKALGVGDARLVAMYDNVIQSYVTKLKHIRDMNGSGYKYVRFCNVQQRWVPARATEELCKVPIKKRKVLDTILMDGKITRMIATATAKDGSITTLDINYKDGTVVINASSKQSVGDA